MSITDINAAKMQLRHEYRAKRAALLPKEKEERDEQITRAVRSLNAYHDNRRLFIYVSMPLEVDTRRLIRKAWEDGKQVMVPRCVPRTREMEFYTIGSFEELKSGAFGVEEPLPDPAKLVTDLTKGLCIVPALCYDSEGHRLGYGKGYYDRFLSRFGGEVIGICYSEDIRPCLPRNEFDRAVDTVVTERWIRPVSR